MNQQSKNPPKVNEMTLIYTGAEEHQPTAEEQRDYRLYPYMPSKELREAVNLAIYLKRPLLIKGEPGSGKTRLAFAVAHEFSRTYYPKLKVAYERELEQKAERGESKGENNEPNPFEMEDDKGYLGWPFYFWPVKSTSRAQDGLYVYDAVGRLHNATLPDHARKQDSIEDYINYGPLGKAFSYGSLGQEFETEKMRPIVLIDEIDKADIDFPNDLLIELEDPKFKIKELEDQEIKSEIDPIIFVTSNDEKDLPDAFLRRCIFFFIDFPTKAELQQIVRKRVPDHDEDLVVKAVDVFMDLRQELKDKKGQARKLPSTSELIDWVKVIHRNTSTTDDELAISEEEFQKLGDPEAIRRYFENLDHGEKLMVDQVKSLLDGRLPFLSVLIKNYNDYEEYIKEHEEKKKGQPAAGEEPDGLEAIEATPEQEE